MEREFSTLPTSPVRGSLAGRSDIPHYRNCFNEAHTPRLNLEGFICGPAAAQPQGMKGYCQVRKGKLKTDGECGQYCLFFSVLARKGGPT